MSAGPIRRVLYANQIGQMSGAERSLVELLDGLPADIEPAVACPEGELAAAARALGIPTHPMPSTDMSFRLHPAHTTRGLAWIARCGWRLRGLARRLDAGLVHANSTRAGLAAALAARAGGRPTVVHVRDWVPSGRIAATTLRAIELGADAIIANSRYVAGQFSGGPGACPVRVVHNSVDGRRFDPDRIDREAARSSLGLGPEHVAIAVMAHFVPWKAQDDAVRILARLQPRHPQLRLLLVGSAKFTAAGARFDAAAYERDVRRLVGSLGLEREVLFLGERDDAPQVLRATDLLLVPSWREAFGRSALEAMAMGLPVIATDTGGTAEIVRDGVDGIVLPPRDPDAWADAIDELVARPDLRAAMGKSGRERIAAEFTVERHVEAIVAIYDELLDGRLGGSELGPLDPG
jgi:L-malate glycosyltransferase